MADTLAQSSTTLLLCLEACRFEMRVLIGPFRNRPPPPLCYNLAPLDSRRPGHEGITLKQPSASSATIRYDSTCKAVCPAVLDHNLGVLALMHFGLSPRIPRGRTALSEITNQKHHRRRVIEHQALPKGAGNTHTEMSLSRCTRAC